MASQTQNIQKLLQAEKRAQDVINSAKAKKALRMKQAKEEAKQEVLQFKSQREIEFKAMERATLGEKSNEEQDGQYRTAGEIREMKARVAQNAGLVIDFLADLVGDVKPVLHYNTAAWFFEFSISKWEVKVKSFMFT